MDQKCLLAEQTSARPPLCELMAQQQLTSPSARSVPAPQRASALGTAAQLY